MANPRKDVQRTEPTFKCYALFFVKCIRISILVIYSPTTFAVLQLSKRITQTANYIGKCNIIQIFVSVIHFLGYPKHILRIIHQITPPPQNKNR